MKQEPGLNKQILLVTVFMTIILLSPLYVPVTHAITSPIYAWTDSQSSQYPPWSISSSLPQCPTPMRQAVFPAIMHPSGMSPAFKTSAAVGVRNYPACTWSPQGYADYTGYAQVALYEANRGIWVVRLQDAVYGDTLQPFVYGAETASGLVNYGLRLSRAAGGCVGFDAGAFSCTGGGWTRSSSSGASVTTVSGQAVFPKSPPHANPQTTWVVKTQTSGANQWAQAMASVNPTIAGPPNDGIGLIAFAMKSTNTYGEGGLAVSTSYGGNDLAISQLRI